jgi:ABC-type cobalamin/Fe3+-siderophores transport system ATPase subunit
MARAPKLFSRHVASRLREALADSPAVLIHGPCQSGKTTLARTVGKPRRYRYVSFDDEAIAGAARNDPAGFVSALPKLISGEMRVKDAERFLKERGL